MNLYPKSKLSPSVIGGEFGGEGFGHARKLFWSQWDERMILLLAGSCKRKTGPLPA